MLFRFKFSLALMAIVMVFVSIGYTTSSPDFGDREIKAKAAKYAGEISTMSSSFVYNLDKRQLRNSLAIFLENHPSIRGVIISDTFTEDGFFSYYAVDNEVHFDRGVPEAVKLVSAHSSANIASNGVLIGKVDLYYDDSKERMESMNMNVEFHEKIRFLGMLFVALFVVLYMVFRALSSSDNTDENPLAFGTTKFAVMVMIVMVIFITISIAGGWFILDQNKKNVENRLTQSLYQTLNSIDRNIDKVNQLRVGVHHHITQKAIFQDIIGRLITGSKSGNDYIVNRAKADATLFLKRYELFGRGESRTIVDSEGKLLVSIDNLLTEADIDKSSNSPFINALAGQSTLMPPIRGAHENDKEYLFMAMPIYDNKNKVIAVSFNEVSETEGVYTDMEIYDFGSSGEVIVASSDGNIVSGTRFDADAGSIRLYEKWLKVMIEDSRAYGESGQHGKLIVMRDYLGKEVFTVVDWNRDLKVAFVAKIDKNEVLRDFYEFRRGVYIVIAMMTVFSVPFTMFTLHIGKRANEKVRASRHEIISRLGHAAEFKDNDTAQHIARISLYSEILAQKMPVSREWRDLLYHAAPMHDIGKIGVPDHILNKPGKLDVDEWEIMKQHPQYGADIIGEHDSGLLGMAREIALYHHEKWNGKGYPHGLHGNEIPLSARIIAVADVFDALTCERVYKKAWPIEKAIKLIISESGEHFDPNVVTAFMHSIPQFKDIQRRYADKVE